MFYEANNFKIVRTGTALFLAAVAFSGCGSQHNPETVNKSPQTEAYPATQAPKQYRQVELPEKGIYHARITGA